MKLNRNILELMISTNLSKIFHVTVRFSFERCMSNCTDLGSEFLIYYKKIYVLRSYSQIF